MILDWINKRVLVSLTIETRQEAEDAVAFINAVMQFLPLAEPNVSGTKDIRAALSTQESSAALAGDRKEAGR